MKKQMETRAFTMEIREMDESTGEFQGVATAFNVLIPGFSEKMVPGSLDRTLKHNQGHVPIFKNHSINQQVGYGIDAAADEKLFDVTGKLELEHNATAREQWALIHMAKGIPKAKMGISMGFRVIQESMEKIKGQSIRLIEEIDLMEYSLTPFPANPKSWVTKVRSATDIAYAIRELTPDEYNELMALLRPANGTRGPANASPMDSRMHSIVEQLKRINKKFKEA